MDVSRFNILGLPVELIHHILQFCHPWDVAAFSKTGQTAFTLVYLSDDQYLWRHLFLNYGFDPPYTSPYISLEGNVDWKRELKTRMKAELKLFGGPVTEDERIESFKTLFTMIENSAFAVFHKGSSDNVLWLKRILRSTLFLSNIYSVDIVPVTGDQAPINSLYSQLYPRIRTYFTLALDSKRDRPQLQQFLSTRNKSRAFVYDLRNYNEKNHWGPFMPDGSVNWIHIEHMARVVWANIRELPGSWALTRPPSFIDAPRVTNTSESSQGDWAGVEGTWRRYVCFMDYRHLTRLKYSAQAEGPYNPQFFSDPGFREATRLIEVKLSVISRSDLRFHKDLLNALPSYSQASKSASKSYQSCQQDSMASYPPIFFAGLSKGITGNEATVEGCVVMGEDNVPRWTFLVQTSMYESSPQWVSTGAQIGGIRSAMGVIGTWTSAAHDVDDPAGPFWLWKVDAGSPSHLMEYT
ncbi:hypothetical protein CPB83DRAFT_774506 [Crepidotus variabilis]|uniref:F-box domain-containing protein n=1 Tax=Crepidotus variabilis TaxID=179855 RepID=A0A9P6E7G5_9AGAR|nr:hypothetical protein CPB83DRAFT_774506 [Crepidotus variabilis]